MKRDILDKIKAYFVLDHDIEDEQAIIRQVSKSVSFRGANLWVLMFAILIASVGLNVNSTAVIIGAMLISPLMGPIIGMGLAVGITDLELLKRSAKNFGVATLISVVTATLYFLLTPLGEAQSELLARTSPSLYDVLIAFCGGAAGVIALCTRDRGTVVPGVAIATALMPPLCTAGYGLATGHFLYFLGAFYLFFINTVFIALSTFLGVRMMHFHQYEFVSVERARRVRNIIASIVLLTMIPAAIMTVSIVRQNFVDNNVRRFLSEQLSQSGTQVIASSINADARQLRVVAVGREFSDSIQELAQNRMKDYGLKNMSLAIIQGAGSDSLLKAGRKLSEYGNTRRRMEEMAEQVVALSGELNVYKRYAAIAGEVTAEASALYPQVLRVDLSQVEVEADTSASRPHYVAAIVTTDADRGLQPADQKKLREWLKTRVKADSLLLLFP